MILVSRIRLTCQKMYFYFKSLEQTNGSTLQSWQATLASHIPNYHVLIEVILKLPALKKKINQPLFWRFFRQFRHQFCAFNVFWAVFVQKFDKVKIKYVCYLIQCTSEATTYDGVICLYFILSICLNV